ncbi:MAG TPA: peptidylprolyl isomerase [Acidimicrobiia bacterium]|nr:peptidylprolyl isomerase [Acidimicrobiia bacterium]
MKRLQVLVAALVAVALVGGVTAYLVLDQGATAYTARGQRVSQSDVDSELSALAGNTTLQHLIRQSQSAPLSTIPGSISSTYTAGWLSLRIAQTFADGVVARKRLSVNAADRRAGEQLAVQLLGSEQVIRTLPPSFRSNLRSRFARMAALTRSLLDNPSPALLDAALQACPSHRFVSHILVATLAEAQSLKAQLTAGADFATLAQQQSTDQASAVRGGDVGCLDSQQFVAPFAQAAQTLPIGQVSDPVQTQFGFHLIVVTDKPSSADLESVALAEVLGLARGAAVTVDPRYGVWDRTNGRVVSPAAAASAPSSGTAPATTPPPTG